MQVTTVNGIRMHYAVSGDPAGAPVVFANSLGTDLRVWDRAPAAPAGRPRASSATTCAATASATPRRATTGWAISSPTPPG